MPRAEEYRELKKKEIEFGAEGCGWNGMFRKRANLPHSPKKSGGEALKSPSPRTEKVFHDTDNA